VRNIVVGINVTVDGCCDHTQGIADDELHEYSTDLLRNSDLILFGRKTYQLFEPYWPAIARNQSETKAVNEFARTIDSLEKIVFSNTLTRVDWKNARIIRGNLQDETMKLKVQDGKDISIGGLSIASQLAQLDLIDDYHFLVHPIAAGKGPRLFESHGISESLQLKLIGSRTFRSGVVASHYKRRSA
jgi:dihydrofolate reductase